MFLNVLKFIQLIKGPFYLWFIWTNNCVCGCGGVKLASNDLNYE